MSGPEISCVIPVHERLDLAARCLTTVAAQRDAAIEVIVTDDSRSSVIGDFVAAMAGRMPTVRHVEGPRTGVAVDNWNAGLDRARAPLVLVVHHDEFLVDPLYLRRAVDTMNRTSAAAVHAGVRVIGVDRPSRFGLIAPVASRMPAARRLLPLVNWIGPTAAFVFRASHRFDPAFVQLADVELYGRVLATGPLVRLSGVSVGSLGHHAGQITARIDPVAAARREIGMLSARTPPAISRFERALFTAALRLRAAAP